MAGKRDIHNYTRSYAREKARIESSTQLSRENKDLLFKFDRVCHLTEGISIARRLRILNSMHNLARDYLKKDFSAATKEDIEQLVLDLESKDFTPSTKKTYKTVLKKFFSWLSYGEDYKRKVKLEGYPPIVRGISCHLSRKDEPRVQPSQILTEEEVLQMIEAAEHPRDKAFISMLYELGARIGELGALEIQDIKQEKYGFIIDLVGKSREPRSPVLILSAQHLRAWLEAHPANDKPDCPLWVKKGQRDRVQFIRYGTLWNLVHELARHAKINKRIYPHLFRHSRVTHLLSRREINEAQAKVFFGWVPDSKILSTYSHLASSNVNDALLEVYGVKEKQEKTGKFWPKGCPRCHVQNSPDAKFCGSCSQVLIAGTALQLKDEKNTIEAKLEVLLKDPQVREMMVRRGRELGL